MTGTDGGVATRGRLARAAGPTVGSYLRSFEPPFSWDTPPWWPPDAFAIANLLLDCTEGYRFAVAPVSGHRWPPRPDWNALVATAGEAWRRSAGGSTASMPEIVAEAWAAVRRHRDTPLTELRSGAALDACEALLTLHAAADEAGRGFAALGGRRADGPFERVAWRLLERTGSLAHFAPARVRITPKTQFAVRGITIRSFSRYLALNYESIEARWRRIDAPRPVTDRNPYHLVLLPWPLSVRATAFRPVEGPLDNMDPSAFGFFAYDPDAPLDLDLLERTLREARERVGRVDGVVLPEGAIDVDEVAPAQCLLERMDVPLLVAGVRGRAGTRGMRTNFVHLGVRTDQGWRQFEQAKHHRWCLDAAQIRQYGLSRVLDPRRQWWEAIDLPMRTAQILDLGGGATIAPLVCEDLARLDEVADLLRRVGPTLVISLLLDGPQLPQRWPCRYASILADEPGTTVLTLTSYAMASRSHPAGTRRSRAVGVWSEPGTGLHQLDLPPRAVGMVISLAVSNKTVWTADGRRHERSTPTARLTGVEPLRVSR